MAKRPGRNDPCWCGSGRKSKRCCGERGGEARRGGWQVELPWTMGGGAAILDEIPPGFSTPVMLDLSAVEHPPPLADLEGDALGELRVFEVIEVVDGLGYRVAEVGRDENGVRWVDDVDGSWIAAPGAMFAGHFADDASIRMPDHPDCPLCRAERERRMARANRLRAV